MPEPVFFSKHLDVLGFTQEIIHQTYLVKYQINKSIDIVRRIFEQYNLPFPRYLLELLREGEFFLTPLCLIIV